MATYATIPDLRDYTARTLDPGHLPADPVELEALLEQAERDVDRAAGGPLHPGRRRRFDPAALTAAQAEALARATCAAVEFRVLQGEESLVGGDDGIRQAGSLTLAPRAMLPRRSPKVLEELAGFGLVGRAGMPVTPDPPAAA